jgi:DNA-binding NtrC family response regulator
VARVLIIDDDADFRGTLAETVGALGHTPLQSDGRGDVLAELPALRVDLVLLDYLMAGRTGIEVLRELRTRYPAFAAPIVMLTAYAAADNTIEAMRLGAFDHLEKPLNREQVRAVIDEALRRGVRPVTKKPTEPAADTLVGRSAPMREIQKMIGLAAASDANVLIRGETGTGKELVARTLHAASARAGGPFVAINCAAIPADLLESELFGHVRGAFTGASNARRGSFREADGGTLFLDEIGDMPLAMQAKILRALQEREVLPVGADTPVRVNVRVVAATHRDLQAMIRNGEFRQDLYYRLAVVPLTVPALRERPDDIERLAQHFLAAVDGGHPKGLTDPALARLKTYAWPGNVRELRNAIERAAVVVRGTHIDASDFEFLNDDETRAEDGSLSSSVQRVERRQIERALRDAHGNRSEAARMLGIHRQALYKKMKLYGLE